MNRVVKFCLILVIAVAVPIVPFLLIGELPGERWLSAVDGNALIFGLCSTGLLVADVLLPVPSSIVITVMGARLGFVPGWGLAWIGLSLGNAAGYAIGRLWPERLASEVPAERPTFLALLVSRPVPILAEALALAAGAVRVDFKSMWLACAAGNALYTFVLAAFGATLLPEASTGVWLFLAVLVWVSAWSAWRFFGRSEPQPSESGGTQTGQ